jgi:hypothetical protein
MTGRAKPWFQTKEQLENPDCTLKHERECRIQALWYRLLKEALNSINVLDRFSWDFLGTGKIGSLGLAPTNEVSGWISVLIASIAYWIIIEQTHFPFFFRQTANCYVHDGQDKAKLESI